MSVVVFGIRGELAIDGDVVEDRILPMDIHTYRCRVRADGRYVFDLFPKRTTLVLMLTNNDGDIIRRRSGFNRSAKIGEPLTRGTYYVTVVGETIRTRGRYTLAARTG